VSITKGRTVRRQFHSWRAEYTNERARRKITICLAEDAGRNKKKRAVSYGCKEENFGKLTKGTLGLERREGGTDNGPEKRKKRKRIRKRPGSCLG